MDTSNSKPKKLTIKQKKFVKAYVANDGNGTKAALETYDTVDDKTAGVIAVENLGKPSIRQAIDMALEKAEITMDKVIQPIADGLVATKSIPVGEDVVEITDHGIRLKASAMAQKLMGMEDKESGGNTYIFSKGDIVQQKYVKD